MLTKSKKEEGMDQELLDLYSDYLITSFSLTTATGLSELVDQAYSHDQITRFLGKEQYDQKRYWKTIKPIIREVEREDGVILMDDTIEEKPYTDENEIVCYHYDHTQGRSVKGINIVNFVYHTCLARGEEISIPVAFELVSKTEVYQDKKTGKHKRKSKISKNEQVRERLKILVHQNQLKFKYVLWDSWFSAKENMQLVKQKLGKEFVAAIKANRLVALSEPDKREGQFVAVSELDLKAGQCRLVYLKGLDFPVLLAKQVFINKDGSTGTLYLVSSDTSLTYFEITAIYQKRWNVETFHKSIKQNAALEKSPTKTVRSQSNHIFAAMIAFIKLEQLKLTHNTNHFALKSKLYLKALRAAFAELNALNQQSFAFVKSSPA
jgi:hypothetical protein